MARHQRIGNALAVLGGARPELLEASPGARPKFVALGGVLLSTGGLAVLSAAFAVHMAIGVWWPFALLLGVGWGAVIVNLDRMLLVGMAHDPSLKRNVALAVPRVALALILGVVVATPLTLQIFHKEIDTEIVTMQAEAADTYRQGLAADARFAGLPDLEEKIATGRSIVASGGRTDPQLAVVQGTVAAKQAAYDMATSTALQLETKAQCELDGTCGTGEAGTGTAYQSARANADAQTAVVAAAKAELDAALAQASDAQERSAAQAKAALATDEADFERLTAEQDRLQAAFDSANEGSGGILLRLEALDRLSDTNGTLWAAKTLLSLLFMSIELLPVLMKLLLNFGPPSAYDKLAAIRDDSDVAVEELQQESRRIVAEAQEELLVLAEKERVDRQKEAILARRRAALAAAAAQTLAPAAEVPSAEPAADKRPLWDTGPIIGLAREAAVRTVRTVRRKPSDRVPTSV
ncbi:DUF4407 domain-containing protein [Blastococcus sp. TBT05-19]|uniref:DUF4407 domain-containing protein n=1 Tax=Blastococcus sp. TBT05-19 TaxID=2250581 RepID=UPI000DE84FB8|nr:DUF4407 domain-containing protein [Blastococcus sp. TBT05-19]RBY88113.1 DUF4407 domain-containing protein [Blastococcus sp. TBT05-19]